MSFLEVGILLCTAVIGVSLSALGLGFEPSWTWMFLCQVLTSITAFPLVILAVSIGIVSIMPDTIYDTFVRSMVPTVLLMTTSTALSALTVLVTPGTY
jgi:hypothetical protein